jgi:hypothetical protein
MTKPTTKTPMKMTGVAQPTGLLTVRGPPKKKRNNGLIETATKKGGPACYYH